jgi:hypothetical protein
MRYFPRRPLLRAVLALLLVPAVADAAPAAAPAQQSQQVQISPNPLEFTAVSLRILAATDAGSSGQIWDNASPVMKTIVTRDQFIKTIQQRITQNGLVRNRAWRSIMRVQMAQPQGQLPSGNYLTVNFGGLNKDGKGVVETVSFVLDGDQQWRVVGITLN